MRLFCLIALSIVSFSAHAGPFIEPGDLALRHDIQRLADHGVIKGTVTTWPLAWGPVLADIGKVEGDKDLPGAIRDAMARVRERGEWATRTDEYAFSARVSLAEEPNAIRSFENTPREEAAVSAGMSYTGDWFSADLVATGVSDPIDGEEFRADGSQLSVAVGNWTIAANTLDRWWGPGQDGSLILSNNARPIPALSLDRTFGDAFQTKWLSWIGPWDLSVHFGQMEEERFIPDTRFFGMRFNFRPLPSLEIGISRTAQWCGDGRPCGFDTFVDLFVGKDNIGDDDIDVTNEPGNQLAGLDFRWSFGLGRQPLALYGQFIGEDEAGGFPSRFIAQAGAETSGIFGQRWSYTAFAELALTNCEFQQTDEHLNCAYNHDIYETGYRYRGRVIGHGSDNDSRTLSVGVSLIDSEHTSWQALLRYANLNRLGSADPNNSLTPTQVDLVSADIVHRRGFRYGTLVFGLGYEQADDVVASRSDSDVRAFLTWQSAY